jgi:putative Holliday junction resolvase
VLPKSGKLLALDIGTRRTGVALSDNAQTVAFSRPEIEYENMADGITAIREIIKKENIVGCVVGMPIKLDGTRTTQTEKVEEWVVKLEEFCPILKADERLSTEFAKDLHGFQTKDKHWDSRAAQILLENYINSLSV